MEECADVMGRTGRRLMGCRSRNEPRQRVREPFLSIAGRLLRAPHFRTASLSTSRVGKPVQNMRRNFVAVVCSRAAIEEGSGGMNDETRREGVSVCEGAIRPCRWS